MFWLDGKKIAEIFYAGKSMERAYLGGRCVWIRPDQNKYLMYDKEAQGYLDAGGKARLLFSNTDINNKVKEFSALKDWCLSFVFTPANISTFTPLISIHGALYLQSSPKRGHVLELMAVGLPNVFWLGPAAFKEGDNLVEIACKDGVTALFINSTPYILQAINIQAATGVNVYADRTQVRNAALYGSAVLSAGSVFPIQ